MFESSRNVFDSIVRKYNDYVDLYVFFNNGSAEGVTPFDEFYWRFSYNVKYEDPSASARSGY